MGLLHQALSKIPYIVHRWEMSAETWNNLKTKVMAVHGPNIDWWDVRFKVNRLLVARRDPNAATHPKDTAVEAFNTMYELTPLPYRNNHPDGTPKSGEIVQYIVAFFLLLALVFVGYAFILLGIMIVTALVLGAASAVAGFFRRG